MLKPLLKVSYNEIFINIVNQIFCLKNHGKHIALFFLIFFIGIKFVGLHSLKHFEENDHKNDCDICEYIITSNKVPSVIDEPAGVEAFVIHSHSKSLFSSYSYDFTHSNIDSYFFGRPPPAV